MGAQRSGGCLRRQEESWKAHEGFVAGPTGYRLQKGGKWPLQYSLLKSQTCRIFIVARAPMPSGCALKQSPRRQAVFTSRAIKRQRDELHEKKRRLEKALAEVYVRSRRSSKTKRQKRSVAHCWAACCAGCSSSSSS